MNHHAALIYTMVLVSAADRDMTDRELAVIGDIIGHLPIFHEYDAEQLPRTAQECAALLSEGDGLYDVIGTIKEALPAKLRETAYALACDVAAADEQLSQEELRLLEILRHELEVGRLEAAAIERGTRARFMIA
ncbi:MAG: tellurite resistance TerB family protein [Rhodovibrionaceae bacterium]|nr:tellurite resistance TerB family protein [Rhodovibrionaceae bacterium]